MYVCWEKKKNKNIWIPIDISEFCGWGQFPQYWPQEFARVIFMKSVWAQLVNDRTYICEGSWRKKQTSFHGRYKTAHRTWQCSHKNLGKVEREMVRETHKTVRGCCKSDLIFNLRFDKYQKRENFNVFRQMSWTLGQVGETLLENDKETQWQKPAWVLCLFGGNCALTPQTNGARSSFPPTQPQSTVQYVTWWWWSPIKAPSFCNLSTPGVPCSSPPWVNYPIFAASSFICVRLIRFSSDP